MPKSAAERVKTYLVRKRQFARETGLCYTCRKKKPNPGRVVCELCNTAALERQKRKRQRDRELAEFQKIILEHEIAGDTARDHHLFDTAAQHYQDAMNVTAIAPGDRQRLLQKFSTVSFWTSDPAAATPWRGRILDSDLSDPEKAEKTIRTLLQVTHQMWIDSKTKESLVLCEEMVRIAERHGVRSLCQSATLRLVNHLTLLGRFDEAARYLETVEKITSSDPLGTQVSYYLRRGFIAAFRGQAIDAYADLERAVQCAKVDVSPDRIPAALGEYAIAAIALGDIERGRALCEQALLIVRRNHLGWYVPFFCMDYAHILMRMGRYTSAHGYLLEALSSDAHAPILEERFALAGIPIALHLKDEATLLQCIRPAAIDLAFQSGEPARIGPIAAAFAQFYAVRGQHHKARALLHRALKLVTYLDESIDLPLVVAQYGADADLPAARALLETRAQLPSADVARACTFLFDAHVTKRTRKSDVQRLAAQAAEHFDRLHWYAYSDRARSLIPLSHQAPTIRAIRDQTLSSMLPTLTERERQVVELVLKGHTNREIARQLAIREHTVEKHMSSIMNRFGVRSRHQLVDAVANTP